MDCSLEESEAGADEGEESYENDGKKSLGGSCRPNMANMVNMGTGDGEGTLGERGEAMGWVGIGPVV